ncbi:fungal-specific transcription factor domain-containing protein [Dissophora ornata]|nr:fungal-specific transcription factor domain-containing protein [Dissophora ornata]
MKALPSTSPSMSTSYLHTASTQVDSDGDDEGLGELAATMDKLRLFDASYYLGKGTMLFTSTDQNQFWDEEISFDVHEAQDFEIPPEAFVLPPLEAIDALFEVYYSHYYVFLPMIQKTTLLQALEDRYEPQSIFLLNSVFTAAALTGDCNHPSCFSDPKNPKTLSTPFFERARMVLDYCMGIPRVSTVQGLIMLSRHPKISGMGHHYVQIAVLMALDLGLHRKCDRWIPDKQVQETRKRVFWCIYTVDSSVASVMGRRPLIDDAEIDVPMVVTTATEGEVEYSNTLFLVHICKLWRIFRDVKQYIFNATEVQDMVPGSLPKKYEQQLVQWQLQLPAALRFSFDLKVGDPGAMYNARGGVAQMLYQSAFILLHKPFLSSTEQLKRSPYRSQDICIKAASTITNIAKVLVNTYSRTFEITNVPEYSTTNAIRIQVMYMKSTDPKISEESQTNFDYLMRFFREFYSSHQCNLDDQTVICVLSFFDEFMHTVKGLSESTVHVCASAIKSMAIAKRSKISLGRLPTGEHGRRQVPNDGDGKSLSRLVRIGREERAKARANSLTPPSMSLGEISGINRKRHSQLQHECQEHFNSSHYSRQDQPRRQEPASSPSSSLLAAQDGAGTYNLPGKVQRVSQYVEPFGGPLVMESLNQYQMPTTILNQPPSNSAIPQTNSILATTGGVFQEFSQQQLLQQHQFLQSSQSPRLLAHPQQQPLSPTSQSLLGIDILNPSYWDDFKTTGMQGASRVNTQRLSPNIPTGGVGVSQVTTINSAAETSSVGSRLMSPSGSLYDIPATAIFNPMQLQLQQQHATQVGLLQPMKVDTLGNMTAGQDEGLSADQVHALLEQTLATDTHNTHVNLNNPTTTSAFQQQHPTHQLTLDQQLGLSGAREGLHPSNWHNMM